MSSFTVKTDPTIEDVLMAADAVDTIRHEIAIQETEILSDDRRLAIKARLRQYYASQGIEVPDEVIDRAVEDMDKNRYTHTPLEPGVSRYLANLWVDRRLIFKRTIVAFVLMIFIGISANAINDVLFVQPREKALAELEIDLETRLPVILEDRYTKAVALATQMDDEVALTMVNKIRDAALKNILSREAEEARSNIKKLEDQLSALRSRNATLAMRDEYQEINDTVASANMDDGARRSVEILMGDLDHAVKTANQDSFRVLMQEIHEQLDRIATPLSLKIVDRDGIRAGVWRSQDNGRTKVYYLIVEAVDENGLPVSFPIMNYETGKTETVDHWGIRVSEDEYTKVERDKRDNGVIDNDLVGLKPAGSLDFNWSIPQLKNQMITRW